MAFINVEINIYWPEKNAHYITDFQNVGIESIVCSLLKINNHTICIYCDKAKKNSKYVPKL